MTHRATTITLLFALVSATAQGAIAAEDADVTADRTIGTQPLPHEQVNSVFEKIARRERVEADVLHAALIGPQSALRADAARMLAEWGNESSIPHLIHALTDDSTHVGARYPDPGMATTRYWAAKSLRKMTGRDFGYRWNGSQEARNTAVLRWTTWYLTVLPDRSPDQESN